MFAGTLFHSGVVELMYTLNSIIPKNFTLNIKINSFMLITFANRLDLDQARQNVGPDLDPICLTHRWYS